MILAAVSSRSLSRTFAVIASILMALFAIKVLPCLAQEHSGSEKSNRKLVDCLQDLMTANTFDDGMRGESPGFRENYQHYLKAAGMLAKLPVSDLAYLRDHGSPAGRIYGAILLKQSGQSNGASFEKLLGDKSAVNYFSGCKGTTSSVENIARSFIDKGCYLNFSLVNYCTVPLPSTNRTEVEAASLATLMSQTSVEQYGQGYSNQPTDAWRAFHLLLQQGVQAKSTALKLLSSEHSGARIYGAVLLRQFAPAEGANRLHELSADKAPVTYRQGCMVGGSTVAALCERLLNGEELILLKDPRAL